MVVLFMTTLVAKRLPDVVSEEVDTNGLLEGNKASLNVSQMTLQHVMMFQ